MLDLTDPHESGRGSNPDKMTCAARFLGCSYADCPEKWEKASPITYVDKSAPPILFINSSQERFHAGRDELIAFYNTNNIYCNIITLNDAPHTFWLFGRWFEETYNGIVLFLNDVLSD